MKRYITLFVLILFLVPGMAFTQEGFSSSGSYRSNNIRSGFTLKVGPVFPIGNFSSAQIISDPLSIPPEITTFQPQKLAEI
ncbi:MAG: hypothetical protein ISR57_02665 [Bacteroidales bacterium]|nr:hypothetical protein [Bacteroidales bacterium]